MVGVGIRGLLRKWLELSGGIARVDLKDFGDDTVVGAGALFNVAEGFSFVTGYSHSDDADQLLKLST